METNSTTSQRWELGEGWLLPPTRGAAEADVTTRRRLRRVVLPLAVLLCAVLAAFGLSLADPGGRSATRVDWVAVKEAAGRRANGAGQAGNGAGLVTETTAAPPSSVVTFNDPGAPGLGGGKTGPVDEGGPVASTTPGPEGGPVVVSPDPPPSTQTDTAPPDDETRQIAIVGGTYDDRSGGVIGTTFLFDRHASGADLGAVTITGPTGWNDDTPFTCGDWQPPGSAGDLVPCWVFTPPVSGTYRADADSGGQHFDASFTVDASSQLAPPQITDFTGTTSDVAAHWAAQDAGSFVLRVNDVAFQYSREKALRGPRRGGELSNLSLTGGSQYQIVVFEFSADITANDQLPANANVSADSVVFTPSPTQ